MVSGFGRPVGLHFLPEDRATVDRALVTGRTLFETSAESPLAAAVQALAAASAPASTLGRGKEPSQRRHPAQH